MDSLPDSALRVVIVQRRMTHYRIKLFDLMKMRLASSGIYLDVVYGDPTEDEVGKRDGGHLSWGTHVPCRYFLNGRLCWQDVRRVARGAALTVVTQENKLLVNYLLMVGRKKQPLAFWGHGRNFQADSSKRMNEAFKRWMSVQCDWWFAYTEISAQAVMKFGYPRSRITVLNNSVDTAEMKSAQASIVPGERADLRARLGIGEGPVGIVIASLHADKRLEFIIDAVEALRQRLPDFHLIVLGDGPQRALIEGAARRAGGWMHWMGVQKGRDKMLYLSLADVIINPGMIGLNILDSFVGGVPVITTDCGIHSPEVAYIENGVNGIVTANDPGAYVDAVSDLLKDRTRLEQLRAACLRSADDYSVERMADNFCAGIEQFLQTRKGGVR